jgi:hypothetical protein
MCSKSSRTCGANRTPMGSLLFGIKDTFLNHSA